MQRTPVPVVDVEAIATPRHLLLTVFEGRPQSQAVSQAVERGFDFIPVVDGGGPLIGFLPVQRLKSLCDTGSSINRDDQDIVAKSVPDKVPIVDLLQQLSEHGVLAVIDTDGARDDDWFALLTTADLNRHAFRGYLYPLFALMESDLAKLISTEYRMDTRAAFEKFVKKIPKYNRATVLGRWELDKLENVETDLLAGCTLSDLLEILKQSRPVIEQLGYSGQHLNKLTSILNDLRNDVMHPVRPMVRSLSEVDELRETVEAMITFIERVQTVLLKLEN